MAQIHRQIIDLWDSPDALAADVGFKADRVRKWRQRGIPTAHWPLVISAAKRRDMALTWEMFDGQEPLPPIADIGKAA